MKRRTFINSIGWSAAMTRSNLLFNTPQAMENLSVPNKIKPARLKEGDTIAVIAPSSGLPEHVIQRAIGNLEKLGFVLKLGKNIRAMRGYLAGTDQQRLDDLHAAFADKSVKAVWCIRGGYGATRFLPQLNYDIIRKNPKIFIGYSDITALHVAIHQKTGLTTFHGPVGTSDFGDYTKPHVLNILMHPTPNYKISLCPHNTTDAEKLFKPAVVEAGINKSEIIVDGKCRGQLIGGNLSLLSSAAGTQYALKNVKGKILFMEDVDERPYRIDRMLTQLMHSVDLRSCAGIALGIFDGCNPTAEDKNTLSLSECLHDRLGHLGIPVIYGLSFGHIKHQCTLPYGIEAELNTTDKTLTLLESAVV